MLLRQIDGPQGADAEPSFVESQSVLQEAHGRVQLRVGVHGAAGLPIGVPVHLEKAQHGMAKQRKAKQGGTDTDHHVVGKAGTLEESK